MGKESLVCKFVDNSDRTYPTYERKTIDIMKRAVYVLRMAYIYAKRVDWMLSGDDNEESLAKRLEEEIQALKAKYSSGKFTFKEKDVYFDKECERYTVPHFPQTKSALPATTYPAGDN